MSTDNHTRDITQEIECYSLPYGALGFASHVFTYYTIVCLWFGLRPLWPFGKKPSYGRFGTMLASIGLLMTVLMAIVTLVKCKNTWELLAIGVWKLSMSVLNGMTGLHVAVVTMRARRARRRAEAAAAAAGGGGGGHEGERGVVANEEKLEGGEGVAAVVEGVREGQAVQVSEHAKTWTAVYWFALYIPGLLAGFAGLMSLIVHHIHHHPGVKKLTIGFWVIVGLGAFAVLFIGTCSLAAACSLCNDPQHPTQSHPRQQPPRSHQPPPRAPPRANTDPNEEERFFMETPLKGWLAYTAFMFVTLSLAYSDWALGMMANNILGFPSKDNSAFFWTYFVAKRLTMFTW